jgi:hypothetical protein
MNELLDNATLIVHAKNVNEIEDDPFAVGCDRANRGLRKLTDECTFNPRLASNIVSLCYDDSAADRSVVECWTQ